MFFLNPIYVYGKRFQSIDTYEEWHKIFLNLYAISDEKWNRFNISVVYNEKRLRII